LGSSPEKGAARQSIDALPKDSAAIVYNAISDDDRRENAFGLLMSLNMLIETHGGFDYAGEDCQAWMREAGFSKNTRRTACWPEIDGDRIEVDHPSSGSPTHNGRESTLLMSVIGGQPSWFNERDIALEWTLEYVQAAPLEEW
jgi:hypothetical protein